MEDKIKLLKSELGEHRIKRDVNLSEYLKSGLGGMVPALFIATSVPELIKIISLAHELKIKFLLVGSGSKFKLDDPKFGGLIIKNKSSGLKIFGIKGKVSKTGLALSEAFLEAESGVDLNKLSEYTSLQMLTGFESLISSSGTIGGSILSDPHIREKTYQVKILNSRDEVVTKELGDVSSEDIILSVIFKLKSAPIESGSAS